MEPSRHDAIQKVFSVAHERGAELEILIEDAKRFSVSYQKGRPEKVESSDGLSVGLRAVVNGVEGFASAESMATESLLRSLDDALMGVRFSSDQNEKVTLPQDIGTEPAPLDLNDPTLDRLSVTDRLKRAEDMERAAYSADPRIVAIPYSNIVETRSRRTLVSSHGWIRSEARSGLMAYTYPLARDGDDNQMSGESLFTRRGAETDLEALAKKAALKSVARLGAVIPKTGLYPVLFESEAMESLLSLIIDDFSARQVFEKKSLFLADHEQKVASSFLTLVDDPHLSGGLGSSSFDGEGYTTRKNVLIEGGVLKNWLTDSLHAARLGVPHHPNAARSARGRVEIAPSNLVVVPGKASREELLRSRSKVIVISDLTGLHAGYNGGSGDFSLQADGELWFNGERQMPLRSFVVSGNIKALLQDIVGVGSELPKPTGVILSPDVLVRELSIVGQA
jgi:PmbA protein